MKAKGRPGGYKGPRRGRLQQPLGPSAASRRAQQLRDSPASQPASPDGSPPAARRRPPGRRRRPLHPPRRPRECPRRRRLLPQRSSPAPALPSENAEPVDLLPHPGAPDGMPARGHCVHYQEGA